MSNDGPQYPQYPGEDQPQSPPGGPTPQPPPPPPGQAPTPPPVYGQTTPQSQPPPPPPPNHGQAPPPGYGPPTRTNPKATWAMILGILGMVCCGLFAGIPAIVLGHQARGEIDASIGTQEGRGMATAGFVLGIISTAISVLYIAFMIVAIAAGGFGQAP